MRIGAALLAALSLSGCVVAAAAVVAAAVGVGAYLYVENELSYEYSADLEAAWTAAIGAMGDLSLRCESQKKDFQSGTLESHMSDGRNVRVLCERLGERRCRVRVRVGDFTGEANRQAAQTIHEAVAKRMGLKAPPLPPAEEATDEVGKTYGAGPAACFEAVLKAAGKSGYKVDRQELRRDGSGSVAASAGGKLLLVTISTQGERTRVVAQVRGPGSVDDSRAAATAFHDALGDELKEKGRD